jgi:hypothetical protein
MHLWLSLPTAIEKGSARFLQQKKEVEETDGGFEVRNTRWSGPLRSWQVGYPNKPLSDVNHAAVEQMYRNTNAGTDTFNFYDEKSDDTARVRFDGDAADGQHDDADLPHRYVHAEGSAGRFAGAHGGAGDHRHHDGRKHADLQRRHLVRIPDVVAKQWTRDGVDIAGATGNTHLLVSGDHRSPDRLHDRRHGRLRRPDNDLGGRGRADRMTATLTTDFQDHLKRRSQQRCRMLRLDLFDGTILGFTDHDKVLDFDLGDGAGSISYRLTSACRSATSRPASVSMPAISR